jgi:hypothetical protein
MFLSLLADHDLDDVRSSDDTHRAITARIDREVNDGTLVPEFVQKQIDDVTEQIGHLVMAEFPDKKDATPEEQEEMRYLRVHAYYLEFIRSIEKSQRAQATREFDEYFGVLIRNANEPMYTVGVDSNGEVFAA